MAVEPLLPPADFRKQDIHSRRAWLAGAAPRLSALLEGLGASAAALGLFELLTENAVGAMPVPLGIAPGFVVNGTPVALPLATEEPSVVAAAGFGARLAAEGFTAVPPAPLLNAAVYLEGVTGAGEAGLRALGLAPLVGRHRLLHPSLYARGGGLIGSAVSRLPDTGVVKVSLTLHVCDAMGANIANSAAEGLAPFFEEQSGGRRVLAILSNAAPVRLGRVTCRVPLRRLARAGFTGGEMGRRIELACRIAAEDPDRAVTHNKGIMNGVSALALATGNDTRGLEAAVHAHAARDGYKPLSEFVVRDDVLEGTLAMPLPLGTVGGAVSVHPAARFSLGLLGDPDAATLCSYALALGLAQNLAALAALAGEGIQQGHMRLHASRLALEAGAEQHEAGKVAAAIVAADRINAAAAREALLRLRAEGTADA